MKNKNIKKLTYASILAALAIAINLTNYLPIPRLYLGYIPLMVAGFLLGPFFGAAAGIVTDLVGYSLTGGAFLPIFTLTSALAGLIPGLFSYLFVKEHNLKLWQGFVSVLTVQLIVLPLNLYGVVTFFGKALGVIFMPRLILAIIMVPVFTVCVTAIVKLYYRISKESLL